MRADLSTSIPPQTRQQIQEQHQQNPQSPGTDADAVSPQSCGSSCSSSVSSRSRRSRSRRGNSSSRSSRPDSPGGGAASTRKCHRGKNYDSHVPVFPNLQCPANIVLEPFPNRRVRSICTAAGLLITAHRNGIRVYRQRYLDPAAITNTYSPTVKDGGHDEKNGDGYTDVRTGLWEAVECRDNFQLQDAYLCVSAESVFSRGRVLPLKWNRYVAAACGTDRTRFSVCVLSTAAHFVLHHELHAKNKVVALTFALVAMGANSGNRHFQPFVVSVDEVGEVVIFDVERDRAVRLTAPVASVDTPTADMQLDDSRGDLPHSTFCRTSSKRSNTGNDRCFNSRTERPVPCGSYNSGGASGAGGATHTYRLEDGLASNVCLVGPCQVLCKHCNGNENSSTSPGTLLLSLFISSRAHGPDGQAELHVQQLRVLWSFTPLRAVVLSETPIVRECAPEDVCDLGTAMLRVPVHEELPPSVMIGRPRLRFWSLSGCSGKLVQLHRVYRDTDGSGKGARTLREHFVRAVPLGRHVLVQDTSTSWFCIAALTDDDVILLLGQEPRPVKDGASSLLEEKSATASAVETSERQVLEAWLDEVEDPVKEGPPPPDSPTPERHQKGEETEQHQQGHKEESPQRVQQEQQQDAECIVNGAPLPVSPPLTFMDPNRDYTVLMTLTNPGAVAAPDIASGTKPIPPTRQLVSLPQSNELLFTMGGTDLIYSIKLPFVWHLAPSEAKTKAVMPQVLENSKKLPNGWIGSALAGSYALDLNIARPLMSAMWGLTGGVELDEAVLPPVTSSPPQQLLAQEQEQRQEPSVVTDECRASSPSPSRGVMAVRIDSPRKQTQRKKKRRSCSSSVISVEDRSLEDDDDDTRRAYVECERQKILEEHQWRVAEQSEVNVKAARDAALLTRLITMEEPLQRNSVVYEWGDAHDSLYVQFTQEGLDIKEKTNNAVDDAAAAQQASQRSLRDCFILSELGRGDQSAGFMQAFRSVNQKRMQLRDNGGTFDFAAYFSSGVVPQRLLDLQEDDRCRFELADLKAVFEDDMKKFHAMETVVVYENEERVTDSNGRRRWMPHQTFPYDDENGVVVDMATLNATAEMRSTVAPVVSHNSMLKTATTLPTTAAAAAAATAGWRWAKDNVDKSTPRPGGSKLVRKELQLWDVGEWMYAGRWPNREEELQGAFKWSATASDGTAKVRRRRLTRTRINIAVEAAKEARHQEYTKKLEQLRMELGL
ncbi:hypothetical protein DQ04_01581050 [Trypanosoma grayi]|uniref:hypothetical protein n=1 Tax=Trypanosoma grayi TaxID=71804 RepID=UPI0004F49307|nr:hypothetical protein DQ04_01581050 [Trypanosoma grayi]KEG12608.1 hypothetical protein DQ04_01581050 [Trypanosoma grayi]